MSALNVYWCISISNVGWDIQLWLIEEHENVCLELVGGVRKFSSDNQPNQNNRSDPADTAVACAWLLPSPSLDIPQHTGIYKCQSSSRGKC